MPSSRRTSDPKRAKYLSLSGQIESQLREAYGRKHAAGKVTQSSIASRLGINRSAVHHRLMGRTNMTIETIADMVWALDHDIVVNIYDPLEVRGGSNDKRENAPPLKHRGTPSRSDNQSTVLMS